MIAGALVVLLAAGCGGDEEPRGTTPAGAGATSDAAGQSESGGQEREDAAPSVGKGPASPRDTDTQRGLKRELKQRSVGGPDGWTFADLRRVLVRGSDVTVETDFGAQRRPAAGSLCLAARRFFLRQGQGQVQTLYDVAVTGRKRATLARC